MFLGIIRNIKDKIAEAYQACAAKGATLPESKKLANLASTILAIDTNSDGVHPTGSKTITSNGTHDVFMYAEAVVDVPIPEFKTQEKTVTENGDVLPDNGFDGLSKVSVNVLGGESLTAEAKLDLDKMLGIGG